MMDPDGLDRRGFLALTGGALICTIAGQEVSADEGQIDVEGLSKAVPVPPKVAAADWSGGQPGIRPGSTGSRRSRSPGTSSPPTATR
jgi:hypothetical protein